MNKPRILIVEDDQILATDVHSRLELMDYQPVGHAVRADHAVALAEELRPDLVLMDIRLEGGTDGIAAAAEIRQRFHIPSLFLSGFSETATIARAKLAEPFGYLLKPFEDRELKVNIEMALHKHRVEEALRASEERYRTVADFTYDMEYWRRPDGSLAYVSPSAERITSYRREEFLLAPDLLARIVHPEDRPEIERHFAAYAETTVSLGVCEMEFRILTRHGETRWLAHVCQPVTDPAGKYLGRRASNRDITVRKHLEARAWQAQKMEAVGHLAGGMAHEFNNILAAQMMNLSLLKSPYQEPGALHAVDEVEALSLRAAGLIKQLLAFSQQAVIYLQPLNLAALVAQQCSLLSRLLGERIRVEFSGPELPAWVNADQSSLEQILLNLGLNARDAMPGGGVLRVGLTAAEVGAAVAAAHSKVKPGPFVCLSVADTGGGMGPEIMARLFEPFFTTKDVGQGTGLGLATVRGLVEQHLGWVEAESRVGVGSTFRVYLPAAAPVAAAPAPAARGPGMLRGSGTILLVEDEPALLKVETRLLTNSGYTVLTATDGAAALALWAQHQGKIDLLFTDMVMPGELSGLDLANRLLADQPKLKVIITSGYNTEMQDLSPDADASLISLPKPCHPTTLLRTIQRSLGLA